jgi:hypothetical protein
LKNKGSRHMPEVDRLEISQLLMNLYSLAQSSVSMQVKDWAQDYCLAPLNQPNPKTSEAILGTLAK